MAKVDLTAQRLRELLDYNSETGIFTRRAWRGGTSRAGSVAGASHGKSGYLQISIDGRLYFAHRLAWLHHHGRWPNEYIDHINGHRADNRIGNLRDVSRSVNMKNRHKTWSSTGVLGVFRHRDAFISSAVIDGKPVYLGRFGTVEAAKAAFDQVHISP